MNESDFHSAVDAALARMETSLEDAGDLDTDLESGILTITCPDDSRIIVNRQTPNREIWIAARSGGFHFAFRDGAWRTRARVRSCMRRSLASSPRKRASKSCGSERAARKRRAKASKTPEKPVGIEPTR
jgi:CyaY protein